MHHLFFMAFFMKQLPLTNLVRRLAMVTVLSSKFGIKYALGAVMALFHFVITWQALQLSNLD